MGLPLENPRCPDPEELLQALVDGRLDAKRETKLLEHLSGCRQCRQLLDSATSKTLSHQAKKFLSDAGDVPPELEAILSQAELDISESAGDEGFAVRSQRTQSQTDARNWADIRPFIDETSVEGDIGQIGEYRVTSFLGRGGMGAVFAGIDPKLNRPVAIKVLSPALLGNETAIRRFLREAQAVASISQPSIIGIYAVEHEAKLPFFVMEFVDGQPLDVLFEKKGRFPAREVLRIGYYMASGLAAAHGAGLIHRDVKPANVLIENGSGRVRLLDFGLARGSADKTLTASGAIMGTPAYMAPETIAEKPQDARTDLFSLGAVMYHMLSGKLPFEADTAIGTIQKISSGEFVPVRSLLESAPPALCDVIEKLLQTDPNKRFQNADDVVTALKAARRSTTSGTEPSAAPLSPFRILAIVASCFLAVGIIGFALSGSDSAEPSSAETSPSPAPPDAGAAIAGEQTEREATEPIDVATAEPAAVTEVANSAAANEPKETTTAVPEPTARTETTQPKPAETVAPMAAKVTPKPSVASAPRIVCFLPDGQSMRVDSLDDAVDAVSDGGRVELPGGDWKISGSVEFESGVVEIVGVGEDRVNVLFDFDDVCFLVGKRATLSLTNIDLRCEDDSSDDMCCVEVMGGKLTCVDSRLSQLDGTTLMITDNGELTVQNCEIISPSGVGLSWSADDAGGMISVKDSALAGYSGIFLADCGPDVVSIENSLFLSQYAIAIEAEEVDEDEELSRGGKIIVKDSILLSAEGMLSILIPEDTEADDFQGNWRWTGARNVYSAPILALRSLDEDEAESEISRIGDWMSVPGIQELKPRVARNDEIEELIDLAEALDGSTDQLAAALRDLKEQADVLRK